MSAFDELAAIPPQEIIGGLLARVVHADRITLAVVEIEPDAELPEHSHENEQLGLVLSGSVTFRVGEEARSLGPGGIWRIPANTSHFLRASHEGAVVLDVFTPPRNDWKSLDALRPRQPRWP